MDMDNILYICDFNSNFTYVCSYTKNGLKNLTESSKDQASLVLHDAPEETEEVFVPPASFNPNQNLPIAELQIEFRSKTAAKIVCNGPSESSVMSDAPDNNEPQLSPATDRNSWTIKELGML